MSTRRSATRPTRTRDAVTRAVRDAPCPDGGAPSTDEVVTEALRARRGVTRMDVTRALESLAREGVVYLTASGWRCSV